MVIQISGYPQPHYKPVFLDELLDAEQSIPSLKRHNSMCVFRKGGVLCVIITYFCFYHIEIDPFFLIRNKSYTCMDIQIFLCGIKDFCQNL